MHRIAPLLLLGVAAFAQTDAPPAEKPPVDVDQTLRSRVTEFYTMMKNHEYRKAESFIAEDTKDYYYDGPKPDIHSFEVLDVEYSEHFTRAKATTKCSQPLVIAGFPPGEINLKVPTLWKFEDGNWYLYEDKAKMASPGGIQSKVQAAVEAGTAAAAAVTNGNAANMPKDSSFAFGKLQLDKDEIQLAPGATEQVTLTNGSPGLLELEAGYPLKGMEIKLDRQHVGRGEKAVVTFQASKEPIGGVYYLRVMPTEEVIAIRVGIKH